MTEPKQIIAKLQTIEDMATEASVKQLCKVMQEYIKSNNEPAVGFKNDEAGDS